MKILGAFVSCVLAVALSGTVVNAAGEVIAAGKTITFDYTLKVDGKVFDTSVGKSPLVFVFGEKKIIPGLEKRMVGLKAGDKKTIKVPNAEAYGAVNPNLIQEIPKSKLGADAKPAKGMILKVQTEGGRIAEGKIQELKNGPEGKASIMVVDFNNPLAGKDLIFDINVIDVK